MSSGTVLIVDDEEISCELLRGVLSREGYKTHVEMSAAAALSRLEEIEPDAILTDLLMDGIDGVELCRRVASLRPELPVIVMTGQVSVDAAVAALRGGAYDFLTKPIDTQLLNPVMARAVRHHRMGCEVSRLRKALGESQRFGEMIGRSSVMLKVFDLIDRVAHSEASVLVTGESGTGKELVARSLHARGRRSQGPFVALNCAALPPGLVESELFGHARGAFTGANEAREGLFVKATNGTLFLDEIGDLPREVQAKLLRALQERRVRPVGGPHERPFDVRLVTATNRDLTADVESGDFREDLLYRIDVVRVELPPLRLRGRDVLLLAQAFVERYAAQCQRDIRGLEPAAAELLLGYGWPGNVRELENCMERAVALTRGDKIGPTDLPDKVRDHQIKAVVVSTNDPEDLPTLDELERRYIKRVLEITVGNKSHAARILGVERRTLYRRLDKHGLS
ncbi:sigma-54-dependent transcriptional regulator [Paraliomyxa miuraensis]|uniref:sigma-54-dependent transcriptional regulator n=1 Tax=Paraliomyxa miuraensis TaxID=376150 RepID=UPI0022577358|nr:sigma-54 dependent transcriptional regulator [Paraliomyxa miuraensis]MCX4239454.1 sigma-54 dependent transcriptional regulator [Paraliomyxa miuraensis]